MNAQEIIDRLVSQLKDPNHTRWPLSDLVDYIEDGQRQVCNLKPSAFTEEEIVKLVPGTRQTIPTDSHLFLRAVMNYGADGATAGNAIIPAEIEELDAFKPAWRSTDGTGTISNALFSSDQPTVYWVYPGVPATPDVYIRILTAKIPAAIVDLGADLDLPDIYGPALYEYAMYRAISKNDDTNDDIEAEKHRGRFYDSIGIKAQADKMQRATNRSGAS